MCGDESAQTEPISDEQQSESETSAGDDSTSDVQTESETEPEPETEDESTTETGSESDAVDLEERIEESDPEQLANEIESLRERIDEQQDTIDEQQDTIDDLESSVKRRQAEFQNYKKRMEKRRTQERKRATEDLVTRLIDVRDNLQRGLSQDGDIREGIETTLSQFDQVLEQENVTEIAPDPGDDVDPQRHEVLMRVESEQPADTIDEVHRSGYAMADKVLREAQVTVSDDTNGDDTSDEE